MIGAAEPDPSAGEFRDIDADGSFQALLQAVPDAMLAVDRHGVIRLVNDQAAALFGYQHDELLGSQVETLVPEHHRAGHVDHRVTYLAHPVTRPMGAGRQLKARRKNGTEFPADVALSHLATVHGPVVIAAVRDSTEQWAFAEQQRLQVQLQQAQRLESLGRLAGGIAHDFNNLLAIILNYGAFVRDALAGDPNHAEARGDAEQILAAAERAAALTHQLLLFSRRDVVRQEVLDLNSAVVDLDKLLQRTLGEDIALTSHLASDLWHVRADRGQVEQVLVNLAVNARDAMRDGGAIVVETANVMLDEDDARALLGAGTNPGPYVRLTVSDSGIGMTAEILDRAFEPFFTTKARGEGSGLGLATVYGIVGDSAGHIRVYSEVGTGTTFRIYLPAVDATPDAISRATPVVAAGHGETVLVAEDEDALRDVTARILSSGGYVPFTAASGEEAMALLADPARAVDVLLTDVVMRGMSGTDLSERATALRPGLRTVFMTGYSEEFAGRRIVPEGVRLVEKPFTAATLLARVREAVTDGR